MKKKSSSTLFMILIVSFFFILPDIIFSIVNKSFKLSHDIKILLLIIPLSSGLVVNRFKWLSILCLSILFFIQLFQFSSLAYFGNLLSPYTLYLFSNEIGDTFQEVGNMFFRYIYILPIVLLPFIGISYCLKQKSYKSIFGTLILLVSFCFFGYKYYDTDRPRFNPNGVRFTIDNSLKAFWGYITIKYKHFPIKNYKPYEVLKIKSDFEEPINIIYIIGESSNYRHMSLFGYERNTTPNLKELSKSSDFYFTTGISGSISTVASCKFIMNSLREADNAIQASKNTTNLFKLAKSNGFKTFYLSNQTEHLLSSISGVNYIDVIKTKDSNPVKSSELMDDYLIDLLSSQKFSNRNFIVLHQRCIHTPYANAFGKKFHNRNQFSGSQNQLIDEYDNAMIYNDQIISKIFNYFNKQKNGKFYIIWASDHNELMGENGLFGHGMGYLIPQTADVPVMIQSNDQTFMTKMKSIFKPNIYEITKNIANILGYEIKNPNEKDNTFYISGVDFNGKCGYIKYQKNSTNNNVNYFKAVS